MTFRSAMCVPLLRLGQAASSAAATTPPQSRSHFEAGFPAPGSLEGPPIPTPLDQSESKVTNLIRRRKGIELRPSPSPATVSAERAISRKPQAPNELPTRSASMPEHLSCGCNDAPRAGPPVPLRRRKRRDVSHATGGGHHRLGEPARTRFPGPEPPVPDPESTRSRPSALLRVFRPCNGGVERRYIPVQWRDGHVARATGNSATEVNGRE
jgi:hypothetical protein